MLLERNQLSGTKNVNLLLTCLQSFFCWCGSVRRECKFWRRWEWWPCERNCLITGVMCNISHIQLIGKVVTSFKVYIRRFRNEKGTGPSYVSQRLLGPLLRTGGKIGQQLTAASPLTIPETIAGRISAPAPFLFLKWRMTMPKRSLGYLNKSARKVYRLSREC